MFTDIHIEPLAPHFHEDEVGKIAKALDAYAQKLTDYVIRDKEFNADVSHELRTPLTVIRSTVELIKSNPKITAKYLLQHNAVPGQADQPALIAATQYPKDITTGIELVFRHTGTTGDIGSRLRADN